MAIAVRSKYLYWALLAAPLVHLGWMWLGDDERWLADYVASSGLWSARFLILALCLTPLRELLGPQRWIAMLIRHRRAIGVASFCYLLLHLLLYLADMGDWQRVLDEALVPSILAGWLAMATMIPPALASNNIAMRALGRSWKPLQRLVYGAAVLTLGHWLLVHDGRTEALLHFAPLAALQAARFVIRFKSPSTIRSPS